MDNKGKVDEPRAVLDEVENTLSKRLRDNEPHFSGRMKKRTMRGDFGPQTSDDLEIYPLLGRHKITSQIKGVLAKYCDSNSPYSLVDKIVNIINSNSDSFSSVDDLIYAELEPFLKPNSQLNPETITQNISEFTKTLKTDSDKSVANIRKWLKNNSEWFADPQIIDFKESQICEYQTKKHLLQIIDKEKNIDGRRVKTPLGYWWTNLDIPTEYGKLSIMEKAKKHLDRARQMFRAGTAMIYSGLNRRRTGNKTGNSLISRGNSFIYQLGSPQVHLRTRRSACFELYQAYTLIRFYELHPDPPVISLSELIKKWDIIKEYPLHNNWVKPTIFADPDRDLLVVNPLRVHNDKIYEQIMGTLRLTPNNLGMTAAEHKIWYDYEYKDKEDNVIKEHILSVHQLCLGGDLECKVDSQVTSDLPFGPRFIATLNLHETMYGMGRFNKNPESEVAHVQQLIQDGTMTMVIQEPDMALSMKNVHIHFGERFYAKDFDPKNANQPEDYFPIPSQNYPFYPTGRLIDKQKPMIYKGTDPNPVVGIPEEPEFWDSRNALEFLRTKTTQLSDLYIQEVNKDRQRELESWNQLTKNMSLEEKQNIPKPDLTISRTQTEWKGGPILPNWTSQNPSSPNREIDLKTLEVEMKNPDQSHLTEETTLIPRLGIEDNFPFLPKAGSIPNLRDQFPLHLPDATKEQLLKYLPLFPYGIPVSENPFPGIGIMFPLVPEAGKEIELAKLQTKLKQDIERVKAKNVEQFKDKIAKETQRISELLEMNVANRKENYQRMLQHALFLLSAPTNEWQKQNLQIRDESHPFYISDKDNSLGFFMRDNNGERVNPVRRGWSTYAWDEKDPKNNPRIGPMTLSHNFGRPGWQPGRNWTAKPDDLSFHSNVWIYRNSPSEFAQEDNYFIDFVGPYDPKTLLPLVPEIDKNTIPQFFSIENDDTKGDDDNKDEDDEDDANDDEDKDTDSDSPSDDDNDHPHDKKVIDLVDDESKGHIDVKHSTTKTKTNQGNFQDIRQKIDGQFIWFSDATIDTYCTQIWTTLTQPQNLSVVYLSAFYITKIFFPITTITSSNVEKLVYNQTEAAKAWRDFNKVLFHPKPMRDYKPKETDFFTSIITPFNLEANHWVLVEMRPNTFELFVYDSMGYDILNWKQAYLGLITSIRNNSSDKYDKKQEWTMRLAKTGRQTDIVNCGAYTCWFASFILQGQPVPEEFTGNATNPELLRTEIYNVLLQSTKA